MAINVTKARIPVVFEVNDDSDNRFKKVKIWIAHTGENLNNSYFAKETLEEMAKTLPKIPIVGYIEADENGNNDFTDHRQEIVIKSGEGADIKYAGHAYGFIPEECNSQFEIRNGKEWLTAEGYVWTKFKDALEIFNSDNGIKSQSMEIVEAEGKVDDIGRMVFDSAVFSALCILGEDVPPAMTGSTVEFYSEKKNQYQFELSQMIEEFEKEKGESKLSKTDNTLDTNENAIENGENELDDEIVEDNTLEKGVAEEGDSKDLEPEPEPEPELSDDEGDLGDSVEPNSEDGSELFSVDDNNISFNFQLSHEDQRAGLYKKLREKIENGYCYIIEMYNKHAFVEQVTYDENYEERDEKMLRVNFDSEGGEISLGEVEEVFPMFLTATEKDTIDNQRNEIEELNGRLEELSEFKEKSELTAKEDLVSTYAEELTEDVVKNIRENFSTMTVEDVEKEVALQFFKKTQAEKEDNATSVAVKNFSKTKEKKYGALDKYFK